MSVRIGYKASAEQFGPAELLAYAEQAERAGFEIVADLGPLPALAPPRRAQPGGAAVARRGRRAHEPRDARHERADADAALRAGGDRAGVRDARLPRARAGLPRRRHRRGDERDAGDRRRVPRPQGAAAAAGGGDRADPQALERGARRLRRRVLQDRARDGLRPARAARADLRRRLRPARREARRARGRRLHLHERQGPRALRGAARERRRRRRAGRPRPGCPAAHDRDQGLLRPRPRARAREHPLVGRARAHARAEGGRRGPGRDGAPRRREPRPRAHALHLLRRSRRGRRGDRPLRRPRLRRAGPARARRTTRRASSSSSRPTSCRCCADERYRRSHAGKRGARHRCRAPAALDDGERAGNDLPRRERQQLDQPARQRRDRDDHRLPRSDFLGAQKRSITSVTHPDDRGPVEREIAAALAADRPFSLEYRIMHADGRIRWVLERGVKTVDRYGVEWLDGIIFDITEPHARRELRIERELEALRVEELEASRARIVAAGDDTRRRIERDLHDGAQQRLVVAALALRAAERAAEPDGEVSALLRGGPRGAERGPGGAARARARDPSDAADRSRARPGRAGARSPLRGPGGGRRQLGERLPPRSRRRSTTRCRRGSRTSTATRRLARDGAHPARRRRSPRS